MYRHIDLHLVHNPVNKKPWPIAQVSVMSNHLSTFEQKAIFKAQAYQSHLLELQDIKTTLKTKLDHKVKHINASMKMEKIIKNLSWMSLI